MFSKIVKDISENIKSYLICSKKRHVDKNRIILRNHMFANGKIYLKFEIVEITQPLKVNL